MIVMDAGSVIRFVSSGMEALTGWKPDELIDLRCDRSAPKSSEPLSPVANALAPPAACRAGHVQQQNAVLPHRKGSAVGVALTFVPLQQEDEPNPAILVVAELRTSEFTGAGAGAGAGRRTGGVTHSVSRELFAEINALRLDLRRRFGADSYLGRSESVRKALRQADLLVQSRSSFLICGPEGSGRRHLARLIHGRSTTAEFSLAVVDCHLLRSEDLMGILHDLRSTVFSKSTLSHQRTGMLLLTSLDRLPREVQQWMLGDGRVFEQDVWVAATTDLSAEEFLHSPNVIPDIASLLSTVVICLEPLHNRGEDVLLLAQHFVEECRRDQRSTAETLSAEVHRELLNYRWPGSVREMRATIAAACQQSTNSELQVADLPFSFRVGTDAQRYPDPQNSEPVSLETLLHRFESDVITAALASCQDNKTEAARRLGMTRPKLYRRMQALGLEPSADASASDPDRGSSE